MIQAFRERSASRSNHAPPQIMFHVCSFASLHISWNVKVSMNHARRMRSPPSHARAAWSREFEYSPTFVHGELAPQPRISPSNISQVTETRGALGAYIGSWNHRMRQRWSPNDSRSSSSYVCNHQNPVQVWYRYLQPSVFEGVDTSSRA